MLKIEDLVAVLILVAAIIILCPSSVNGAELVHKW